MFVRLDEVDAEFAHRRRRRIAKRHHSVRSLHPRHLAALNVHVRVGGEVCDVCGHYAPIDMGAMTRLAQLTCNKHNAV